MKGIVFTEFLSFVEAAHGDDFVDDMIAESGVDAHYTSVGTYDYSELASLVIAYCKMTGTSMPDALRSFGSALARVFQSKFGAFYGNYERTFDFLAHVDSHIHVEVKKLYPDAQLPNFEVIEQTSRCLSLRYDSCRPLADLAVGLIEGSAGYWREQVVVRSSPLEGQEEACWRLDVQLV
jgi:hypothetical protein